MRPLLFAALAIFLVDLSAAGDGQAFPDPLDRAQLLKIIAQAEDDGDLSGRLPSGDFFTKPTPVLLKEEVPGQRTVEKPVKLRTRTSGGEYLILERFDDQEQLLRTDVLRYHYASGLYHRWQISPDETETVRFLFGDRLTTLPPEKRREEERDPRPDLLAIHWRDTGPSADRAMVVLDEAFVKSSDGFQLYQFAESEYRAGFRTKREFVQYEGVGQSGPADFAPKKGPVSPSASLADPSGIFTLGLPGDNPTTARLDFDSLSELFKPYRPAPFLVPEGNNPTDLLPGVAEGMSADAQKNQPEVFEDLNFRYTMKQSGYRKMDLERLAAAKATLFYLNGTSNTGFSINVDHAGSRHFDSKQLLTMAKTRLGETIEITTTTNPKTITLDEVPFVWQSFSGNIGRNKGSYSVACSSYNGYFIQLMCYRMDAQMEMIGEQFRVLAEGFQFLDHQQKSGGAPLSRHSYRNAAMGITFDPVTVNGRHWNANELRQIFPTAAYGTRLNPNVGMLIVPVDLHGLKPDPELTARALLIQVGVDFENQVTGSKPVSQGTGRGIEYEARTNNNGIRIDYKIRILENAGTIIMLCALGSQDINAESLTSLLNAVDISAPLPFQKREEQSEHRKNDAFIINLIGLPLLEQQKAIEALPFFKRAHDIDPEMVNITINLILAKRFSGDPAGALEVYRQNKERFPDALEFASHEPFLLIELGRREEAARSFKDLFANGYWEENSLLEYLNLLASLGQTGEAIEAIDAFLKRFPGSGPNPRRWQQQIYAQDGQYDQALHLARALAEEQPRNEQFANDLLTALIEADETAEALKLAEARLKTTPDNAFLLYQKGLAHQKAGQFKKAMDALTSARAAAPESPQIAAAIDQASAMLGQGDQSAIRQKITPVAIPDEVTRAMTKAATKNIEGKFNYQITRNVVAYEFRKNSPFKTTTSRTVKILNPGGVEEMKTIRFSFDPTYERAFLNSVEIIKGDGSKSVKTGEVESYVSDTSARDGSMGTTMSTVTTTVPGLQAGCTLKFSYTVTTLAPLEVLPYKINYFATSAAPGSMAVILTGDLDGLQAVTRNGSLEEIEGGNSRAWIAPRVPTYYPERIQPSPDHYLPLLAFGAKSRTWKELASDYLTELEDRLTPSPALKKLAAELTATCAHDEEKADVLMRYVQDKLVYQAIGFGRRARIPSKVETINTNRYGDCKDHSLLAYHLFQAAGLPAFLTLVPSTGPVFDDIPSFDQFDHMIVFLPTIRGGTFWDGTEKQASVKRRSPLNLAGRSALVLDGTSAATVRIPLDPDFAHAIATKRSVRPDFDEKLFRVDEEITFSGSLAVGIRSYLVGVNQNDWKRSLEQLLGARQPITILDLTADHMQEPDLPLVLKMKYTVRETLKERGKEFRGALPAIWEQFFLMLNRSGKRHTPFEISVPLNFQSTVTLDLPESHEVTWSAWKEAQAVNAITNHKTTLLRPEAFKSTIQLKGGIFPAEDYPLYASSLGEAVERIEGEFKFQEKDPGSAPAVGKEEPSGRQDGE